MLSFKPNRAAVSVLLLTAFLIAPVSKAADDVAGPGFNIFLDNSDPGDLPGGIAPQPEELRDRGFPSGQGNAELGIHAGGGVDFNLTKKIFAGAEAKYNWVDRNNGSFGTYGGRVGFRF